MSVVNVGGIVNTQEGVVTVSNKILIGVVIALWISVIAVADMNWPQHMGPQNVLIEAIENAL